MQKWHFRPVWYLLTLFLFASIFYKGPQMTEASINSSSNALASTGTPGADASASPATAMGNVIPLPVFVEPGGGTFTLALNTTIYVDSDSIQIKNVAQYLADKLTRSTGYAMPVHVATGAHPNGSIYLSTAGIDSARLGEEGYELTITKDGVTLVAEQPAGLFRGIQTIRQLLPPSVESSTVQPGPWTMPTGTIRDYPRYAWRGAMLDVARHFFRVEDVKRFIDLLAYYKLNRFHLHLSDDQGWRIVINSWPDLTAKGGITEVGGGAAGFYTQADYADIVAYAQSRYITIVPEIDMPGHTNAALASYAKLNCSGIAPTPYTGTEVGFSTLCTSEEVTYTFVNDVIVEISKLTNGPYFHIGGDESKSTAPDDYVQFVERVQTIVSANGRQMVGWEEISNARLLTNTIAQQWNDTVVQKAVQQGAKVIMSPANKAYLDMKYSPSTLLGVNWAAYVDIRTGYDWDPATIIPGVTEKDIEGIEAPLWTETIRTLDDIEFMVFPRLLGIAEIGWSSESGRTWDTYRIRLSTHGSRLTALGVNFYKDPSIGWQ